MSGPVRGKFRFETAQGVEVTLDVSITRRAGETSRELAGRLQFAGNEIAEKLGVHFIGVEEVIG